MLRVSMKTSDMPYKAPLKLYCYCQLENTCSEYSGNAPTHISFIHLTSRLY